ncbi:hypothetical protein R83H12_02034 [Fibrobacteria bacterium R8-3-H12]
MASYEDYLTRLKHIECTEKTLMAPFENEVQELKERLDNRKQEYIALQEQKKNGKKLAEENLKRLAEAEQKRLAAEVERKRLEAEEKQKRLAAEAERKKLKEVEQRRLAAEAEREAERKRLKDAEQEAQKKRDAEYKKCIEHLEEKKKQKRRLGVICVVLSFVAFLIGVAFDSILFILLGVSVLGFVIVAFIVRLVKMEE